MTAGLLLPTHEFVIVPVNNSLNAGSFASAGASGTHWSVLVYSRASSAFLSFDSLSPANASVERSQATKLARALRLPASTDTKPTSVATPHQRNSHDCGVHACAVMHSLARRVLAGERVADAVASVCARATRARVREAIARAGADYSSASDASVGEGGRGEEAQ